MNVKKNRNIISFCADFLGDNNRLQKVRGSNHSKF